MNPLIMNLPKDSLKESKGILSTVIHQKTFQDGYKGIERSPRLLEVSAQKGFFFLENTKE